MKGSIFYSRRNSLNYLIATRSDPFCFCGCLPRGGGCLPWHFDKISGIKNFEYTGHQAYIRFWKILIKLNEACGDECSSLYCHDWVSNHVASFDSLTSCSLCSWHHLHSLHQFCVMLRKLWQGLKRDFCGNQNIDTLKHLNVKIVFLLAGLFLGKRSWWRGECP